MKLRILFLSSAIGLFAQASYASETIDEGKQLFTTYCSACHGASNGKGMSSRLAPPIVAVKMHYLDTYSDEKSFVNALADWVAKPDENKTMMRGAIRRFKLMPAMPIPRADVEKIASYIFKDEMEKPKGFDQHLKEERGKRKGKKLN